ncbi:MAG: hypothetical protein JO021_22730 [Alphaproteobacteria bacterium]|nr:hypothetical protein [Alphaproteobacteria bacterium]
MSKLAHLLIIIALVCSGDAVASDPAANRRASANYDAVVQANPGFRAQREHVECDSIESLDLRAQCVASFEGKLTLPPPPADEHPVGTVMHPAVTVTNGPVRNPDDD